MKITLEAEVMGKQEPGYETPHLYMPGHCRVNLKVRYDGREFEQQIILQLDEVRSTFDILMSNLTRSMRDALISYLFDKAAFPAPGDRFEEVPLMPVIKFERMR